MVQQIKVLPIIQCFDCQRSTEKAFLEGYSVLDLQYKKNASLAVHPRFAVGPVAPFQISVASSVSDIPQKWLYQL